MNRAQRRKFDKAVGFDGASAVAEALQNETKIPDGAKVKLNVDQITARKDYRSKLPAYQDFVVRNRNTVFTARRVWPMKRHSFLELEEDTTKPKWLWWDGDLIVVEEEST